MHLFLSANKKAHHLNWILSLMKMSRVAVPLKLVSFFLSVYLFFPVTNKTTPLFVYIELVVRWGYCNKKNITKQGKKEKWRKKCKWRIEKNRNFPCLLLINEQYGAHRHVKLRKWRKLNYNRYLVADVKCGTAQKLSTKTEYVMYFGLWTSFSTLQLQLQQSVGVKFYFLH